ncbi:MAG: nucleotidyltransferase domain-containing protein [bacterium]
MVEIKAIIRNTILKIFLENNLNIKSIILFGSRARGDFKNNSDWDLLIIVDNWLSIKEKRELSKKIRTVLANLNIPSDVIIKSEIEINYFADFIGSITREALKEGIEL